MHPNLNSPKRSAMQTVLLSCGLVGSILFTITYLIEGALHPRYDLLHQTISSLEVVSYGWTQQVNFVVFGLLTFCFAVGLRGELKGGRGGLTFPLLQGIVAVGTIMSGIFVSEPLHTTGDLLTFISIVIGFFVIATRFIKEPQWKGWALYSILSALLMMVFLAAFGDALRHGGFAGLYERLAALVKSLWTIFFVGRLLTGAHVSSGAQSAKNG